MTKAKSVDRAAYTLEKADPANRRVYYRGRDGWLYCLIDDGQHGYPRVRFCRCTDAGEPLLVVAMPFPSDFDRYVSPVKEIADADPAE